MGIAGDMDELRFAMSMTPGSLQGWFGDRYTLMQMKALR